MSRSDAGAARLGDHALSSTCAFSVVIAVASLVGAFLLRDSAVLGTAMTEMTAVARGSAAAVLAGAGEELFFRNGVRRALPGRAFVPVSAAAHTAITGATGNVALALMAAVLGTVCATALQLTGRWWSPRCIRFTWTLVMIGLYPALTPNL